MPLSNYADLQASVAGWLHRADMVAIIPDLIALAEKRINGDIDARMQDTVGNLQTTANSPTVTMPNDVINLRSLTLQSSPNVVLDYLTPDQFNTQYAGAVIQKPQSFTIIGGTIYLGPTPDSVYGLQCIYKSSVPPLATFSTNWLMTNYPNVYLMATLCEAARYTANDARLPMWETAYAEAIKSVNAQDWYSGSTMRVRSDVRM